METTRRQSGFSLTETLMAVGTLAIGMLFVGGTFMTGIYFATVSTERTIASVVADEAFAKIQLYGPDPNQQMSYSFVPYEQLTTVPREEYLYPSVGEGAERSYSWTAICRRHQGNPDLFECTVFVCRRVAGTRYWVREGNQSDSASPLVPCDLPRPVCTHFYQPDALLLTDEGEIWDRIPTDNIDEATFVNDGSVFVADGSMVSDSMFRRNTRGNLYRVLRRYVDQPNRIKLDRPFDGWPVWTGLGLNTGQVNTGTIWVVPPPISGGRNPCVGVYQRVLRLPGH